MKYFNFNYLSDFSLSVINICALIEFLFLILCDAKYIEIKYKERQAQLMKLIITNLCQYSSKYTSMDYK